MLLHHSMLCYTMLFLTSSASSSHLTNLLSFPSEYPPPYSWVSLFSTENSFKLTCTTDTEGLRHCVATQNPYRAAINQIAN